MPFLHLQIVIVFDSTFDFCEIEGVVTLEIIALRLTKFAYKYLFGSNMVAKDLDCMNVKNVSYDKRTMTKMVTFPYFRVFHSREMSADKHKDGSPLISITRTYTSIVNKTSSNFTLIRTVSLFLLDLEGRNRLCTCE